VAAPPEGIAGLLLNQKIWRGGRQAVACHHVPTGFAALDQVLGGGWPLGQLTELLTDVAGIGELRLLLPVLRRWLPPRVPGDERCTAECLAPWVALIAPPYLPYAPALQARGLDLSRLLLVHPGRPDDLLWAMEQALRSGTCAAVVGWLGDAQAAALRRLQLAAEAQEVWAVLFRPVRCGALPSPAALRLQLSSTAQGRLAVQVRKQRGRSGAAIELDP
jgi:cell division inhibitor SulA